MFFIRTIAAQMHMFSGFMALAGMVVLLGLTSELPSRHFWACLVYGLAGVLVFASSTVYHILDDGYVISPKLDRWLQSLDHASIYIFIAGTYTPFLVNVVSQPWRTILMIAIWTIAILGILYIQFRPKLPLWLQHRYIYTGIFVLMGWVVVIRMGEILDKLSERHFFYLLLGGLAYTIGAVGYAFKKPKLFKYFGYHEVWHLMVMVGFAFHYFMILNFYLDPNFGN